MQTPSSNPPASPAGRTRRGSGVLWSLAVAAGLAVPVDRAVAQEGPDPAMAPIFLNESPSAREALSRAREHVASGNLDAAADVLQRLLSEHTREVTASSGDEFLHVSLRSTVHAVLARNPDLLDRYRQRQSSAASELLAQAALDPGKLDELIATRLLTGPGFEATLRAARRLFLDGHFDAAALLLADLAQHPDAARQPARVNELVTQIAPFVTSPLRRTALAEIVPGPLPAPLSDTPDSARPQPSVLDDVGVGVPSDLVPRPIGTGTFSPDEIAIQPIGGGRREDIDRIPPAGRALRIWPALSPTTAYVSAGRTVWAFDRLTGRLRWMRDLVDQSPADDDGRGRSIEPQNGTRMLPNSEWEESTRPALVGGTLVAAVAQDSDRLTESPETIVGLDPETGATRWSADVDELSSDLVRCNVRGPILSDSGVAVISLVKDQRERRLRAAFLAGLDARTGALRWTVSVGSIGVLPQVGGPRLADMASIDHGVVYRSDRIGVVGAYRTIDGQPLWVRHLPTRVQGYDGTAPSNPWTMPRPVVAGRSVFLIGPEREQIIELDALTGEQRAVRASAELGTPDYLLVSGSTLLAVAHSRIYAVPLAGWSLAEAKMTGALPESGIRGRVTVAGGKLLVPTTTGLTVIDPANLRSPERTILLDAPGTPLATPQGLVVVDDWRVSTYSNWAIASAELRRQITASPDDPRPAAELLSLAERSGRSDEILSIMELATESTTRAIAAGRTELAAPARQRIVELVLTIAQRTATPPVASTISPAPAVLDAAATDRLMALAEPIATTPRERAAFLLVRSQVRERGDPAAAVADAHAVYDDAALGAAPWSGRGGATTARAEARQRLLALVRRNGRACYATFDTKLAAERAALGPNPSHVALESLATRFPAAAAAPDLWLASAEAIAADPIAAARALELGLQSAVEVTGADPATISCLNGLLITGLLARGLDAAAQDAIARADAAFPSLPVAAPSGPIDLPALRAQLAARLVRLSLPAIGEPSATQDPQVLGGWALLEPLIRQPDSGGATFVVLQHADGRTAIFGLADGALAAEVATGQPAPLKPLWLDEQTKLRPDVLSIDMRGVVLFIPDPAGGRLMRVEPNAALAATAPTQQSNSTSWSTEPFGKLFPVEAPLQFGEELGLPRVNTPDRGARPASELIASADAQTIALVERAGRAAAFDAASGRLLWTARLPMNAIHEVSLGAGGLVVAGMADVGPRQPQIARLDPRTGTITRTGPSPVSDVRWIRQSPAGQIYACGVQGTALLDTPPGDQWATRWLLQAHDAASTFDAWFHDGRLLVLTDDDKRNIWRIDALTGQPDKEPVDTRDRLNTSTNADLTLMPGGAFALRTGRGLAIIGGNGQLRGSDILTANEALITPQRVDGAFVSIVPSAASFPETGAPNLSSLYSLVLMDDQSARVTSVTPIRLPATPQRVTPIPGRLIISAGHSTVVVHAPRR